MVHLQPLLNIIMPAYNHEKYIGQAIESVLMQHCNFNYQIIIGEDSSTDRTRAICEIYEKSYPNKIMLLRNTTNIGLVKNYKKIFENCTAKFIAILEADDYWIDPLKLQKQIDVLESDDSIGLVHTRSFSLYENGVQKINFYSKQSRYNYYDLYTEVITGRYEVVPVTVCFRRNLLKEIDFDFCIDRGLKTLDAFLWPEFIMHSKCYFIDDITACYRILKSSESNTYNIRKKITFIESSQNIRLFYIQKYPVSERISQLIIANSNYTLALEYLNIRDFDTAKIISNKLPLNKIKFLFIWIISKWSFFYPIYSLQKVYIMFVSYLKQRIFGFIKMLHQII